MAFDKRGALLGATLLVVLIALVAFGRRPTLVAWHRWRMEAAFRRVNEVGAYSSKQSDYIESHDYHRQRLVELGYLQHRTFTLSYIRTNTPENRRFWRLLQQALPSRRYVDAEGDWYEEPTPMRLEVWDRPGNMSRWGALVREHDVPDFAERFGLDSPVSAARAIQQSSADP